MIASNASHKTTRNSTIPAMKTPALGIMRSIVLVLLFGGASGESRDQLRVDGDFRFVEFGDRAAGFRIFYRRIEFGLVCPRDGGDEIEMAFSDADSFPNFLE